MVIAGARGRPTRLTRSHRPVLSLLVIVLLTSACGRSRREHGIVRRWLLCDDCTAGELNAVVGMGGRAVPTLVAALAGPSTAKRENVRRQIEESYARLAQFPSPDPVPLSQSEYVARYLNNYVARYQSRAVEALGGIATAQARSALRDALALADARGYRGDVVGSIATSVGLRILVQAGDSQTAAVSTLVPIPPAVLLQDTTGAPLRNVRVMFAVDSGGGAVIDSIQTSSVIGVAVVGGWRLGAAPGRNVLRASAAGRVIRFKAFATP